MGTVITALVGVAGIVGVSLNAAGERNLERARIEAEDRRRDDDRREDRRLARQEGYARYIVALDLLDTYGSGYVPSDDKFEEALHELNTAGSAARAIGRVVRSARRVTVGCDPGTGAGRGDDAGGAREHPR